MSSNPISGNELVFDYKKFEKRVVRLYLDYIYGIEGCLENLELSELLELVQFVADDGKADWSSFDAKLWDDLMLEIEK